jgi:hypothetical protein
LPVMKMTEREKSNWLSPGVSVPFSRMPSKRL